MNESRIKSLIWVCLFIFTIIFAELQINYVWILIVLGLITMLSEKFKEYRISFVSVGVFSLILIITLPLTISNRKLDTISLSVSNIEKHGNNVYIKTKEILDKGEITWEELKYLNREKDELSQWCAVFDRQSDIIGVGRLTSSQGAYVTNVFSNQDKEAFNIEQRVKQLEAFTLTQLEIQWLEDLRSRSYEILMSKIVQEGYEKHYDFGKWEVRYLYLDLYKIIH